MPCRFREKPTKPDGNHVRTRFTIALAMTTMLIAGCSSSPDAVTDGEYRIHASSDSATTLPTSTLTIAGNTATFTIDGTPTEATIGDTGAEYVVCPPDTKGTVRPLDRSITFGSLTLVRPALFGDCGVTSPARVTVVDLDGAEPSSGPFPFVRWVEMCDTADPDC